MSVSVYLYAASSFITPNWTVERFAHVVSLSSNTIDNATLSFIHSILILMMYGQFQLHANSVRSRFVCVRARVCNCAFMLSATYLVYRIGFEIASS